MANIELLGNTYNDVPAVELPKSGGGTAMFYENTGSKIELIWTNSAPTSNFSAQTLNFSDSYDYFIITIRISTGYGVCLSIMLPINTNSEYIGGTYGRTDYYRSVTVSANKMVFGAGNSNDNSRAIPYLIFGIKASAV